MDMHNIVTGRLGRLVYAHLEPNADIYESIVDLAESEGIETGMVMDITGALSDWRLSMPVGDIDIESQPGVREITGFAEATGHGVIGRAVDEYIAEKSGVEIEAGRPFVHVHMSVTTAGKTHMGHLVRGCHVRSVHPISHFTVVLAEVEGIRFDFKRSTEKTENYPDGVPIYELGSK